jgi:hypothetical protein
MPTETLTPAARDVLEERRRQVEEEGRLMARRRMTARKHATERALAEIERLDQAAERGEE